MFRASPSERGGWNRDCVRECAGTRFRGGLPQETDGTPSQRSNPCPKPERTYQGEPTPSSYRRHMADQLGNAPTTEHGNPKVPYFLADAPRQASTLDAWTHFALRTCRSPCAGWRKTSGWCSRQEAQPLCPVHESGCAGFRAETVSDFYLTDDDRLSEERRRIPCSTWVGTRPPICRTSSVASRTDRPTTSLTWPTRSRSTNSPHWPSARWPTCTGCSIRTRWSIRRGAAPTAPFVSRISGFDGLPIVDSYHSPLPPPVRQEASRKLVNRNVRFRLYCPDRRVR